MWHASIAKHDRAGRTLAMADQDIEAAADAMAALAGVGDLGAGEWWHWGETAVHLRRRLSERDLLRLAPSQRDIIDIRDDLTECAARVSTVVVALTNRTLEIGTWTAAFYEVPGLAEYVRAMGAQ